MAALGRAELAARLLNNVAFRELLELVPEASALPALTCKCSPLFLAVSSSVSQVRLLHRPRLPRPVAAGTCTRGELARHRRSFRSRESTPPPMHGSEGRIYLLSDAAPRRIRASRAG